MSTHRVQCRLARLRWPTCDFIHYLRRSTGPGVSIQICAAPEHLGGTPSRRGARPRPGARFSAASESHAERPAAARGRVLRSRPDAGAGSCRAGLLPLDGRHVPILGGLAEPSVSMSATRTCRMTARIRAGRVASVHYVSGTGWLSGPNAGLCAAGPRLPPPPRPHTAAARLRRRGGAEGASVTYAAKGATLRCHSPPASLNAILPSRVRRECSNSSSSCKRSISFVATS